MLQDGDAGPAGNAGEAHQGLGGDHWAVPLGNLGFHRGHLFTHRLHLLQLCGIHTAGRANTSILGRKAVITTQMPGMVRMAMATKTPKRISQRCQGFSMVSRLIVRLP